MATKTKKPARQPEGGENIEMKTGNTLSGIVISDKMDKTVVVSVSRFVKHPKYRKFYKINKKYKAHDEENKYKIGDKVEITETKPISKDKKFAVVQRTK